MKILDVPRITLWLHLFFLLRFPLAECEQHVLGYLPRLRNATITDADDIATVVINAFSPLPFWNYVYQFRNDFPEEHHRCVRSRVVQFMSDDSSHVEVIEAPENSNISLVAVALWLQSNWKSEKFWYFMTTSKDSTGLKREM